MNFPSSRLFPACAVLLAVQCLSGERIYPPQASKPLDASLVSPVIIDEAGVQRTIYVDNTHPDAADTNSGFTENSPKRTIGNAIQSALEQIELSNAGVRIFIKNGRYETPGQREIFRLQGTRTPVQPFIIEGESRGGVVVDCTIPVDPESIVDFGDGLYGFPWTEDRGHTDRAWKNTASTYGGEIAHRSETVFVNGIRLRPVILEPHNGELIGSSTVKWTYVPSAYEGRDGVTDPGTFGVSEIEEDMIFFRPPVGVDMSAAEVRVNEMGAFLDIRGKSNLVIRNLVILGPGIFYGDGIIKNFGDNPPADRMENILIEDVEIYSTASGDALAIANVSNFTIRRVIVRDNGGNGFSGTRIDNMLLEDVDFSENSWRSELGGIERWTVAGWKILETTDVVLDRYVAYGNGATGFWFDTDIENATLRELYAVGNSVFGFYNEKNVGDIFVTDSVFMNNDRYGIFNAETGNTVVENSISFHNGDAAFGLRVRDTWNTNGEVLRIPQDIVLRDNLFVGRFPDGNLIYTFEGGGRQAYLDSFVATFSGSGNHYWSPLIPNAFAASATVNFPTWLTEIPADEDTDSVFTDPKIDNTGDGVGHFFLFEDDSITDLGNFGGNESVRRVDPDFHNVRPLMEMPRNWRQGGGIEARAVFEARETGTYTFVLNANVPSELYLSTDSSANRLGWAPVAESGSAVEFREWNDSGNGRISVDLQAGKFYQIAIRSVLSQSEGQPSFLTLGWNSPWMAEDEIRPLAAPYIRSPEDLPAGLDGFLAVASRNVNNSFSLDGYGTFWQYADSRYWHGSHGWLYIPDGQALPGFWGYSLAVGWLYFNTEIGEDYVYSSNYGSWLLFPGLLDGQRYYYVLSGENAGWLATP